MIKKEKNNNRDTKLKAELKECKASIEYHDKDIEESLKKFVGLIESRTILMMQQNAINIELEKINKK